MTESASRPPPSALKGRLADVYVPALVEGQLESLSRRLGNRAIVDDPLHGRASTLSSLDPLIAKVSGYFTERKATYSHIYSTTGVDRDVAEGILEMTDAQTRESWKVPIAVVAERRRLREIELRIYYTPDPAKKKPRPAIVAPPVQLTMPSLVEGLCAALGEGNVEKSLAAFEETGHAVDPRGIKHGKSDGRLTAFLSELGRVDVAVAGIADDGRACCLEATLAWPGREPIAAMLAFQRGESGLIREARLYYDA